MAGFADPITARESKSRRSLPSGPCNYRDVAFGSCGCDQFWDKCSAELHDELAEASSTARSTWCVCGHHACFHLRASRALDRPVPPMAVLLPPAQAIHDDQHQTLAGAQCNTQKERTQQESIKLIEHGQAGHEGPFKAPNAGASQQILRQSASNAIEQGWDTPSQTSTSGLPGIPSVCMLSHDQRSAADNEARHDVNQSRQTLTGLGLSMMQLGSIKPINIQQSQSSTIPNTYNAGHAPQASFNNTENAFTTPTLEANRLTTPSRGILDHVLEFNRNLQIDVGSATIPNTFNPDDFIQSATEVATPSIEHTPDLGVADEAVQEGKNLIGALTRLTSNLPHYKGSPGRPASATSAASIQQWQTGSPTAPQEQIQNMLRSASPQELQKLVSYLGPLHNLLNSIPNVANTMRDLGSRLDMLENGSFNYVQPEELNQTLSLYDDRLVELEHRMDEHDKHHQAIDAEHSTSSINRRHIDATTSFGSNHSLESTTSSALILAAMDRKDTEMELGNIKQRLESLESRSLPTTFEPWEVEVVLLPWGRDLRGIWYSPDEPMHTQAKTTQDSEEWTQAQSSKTNQNMESPKANLLSADSVQTVSKGFILDDQGGWSSQAISDWASGSGEEWLSPKGCGTNGVVYKRLQSRGFVRNVSLKGASARDIQAALSDAFSDLLEHLSYTDQDGDATIDLYPGLRASFIPLRKAFKESRLRFMTPAELASSALWSADFLAAGIMMRVSGGKKRLYVTQREAYIQRVDDLGSSWTWQELRQLPRHQPDQDSQMEGNEDYSQPQIPEADAKETCWQFIETYDAPPASVHSSFGSNQSVQLSMRPADRQWRRSITPSSILKNKMQHPISPLSEFHPRPTYVRNRTASASIVEQLPVGSSKRRLNSSPVKQSSAPQPNSRATSVSMARLKRRRTANSPPLYQEESAPAEAQTITWNPTPRRSREPPSPFYSSLPVLARSNSDVVSRPSQRSIAVAGKSTPFAYATPHSGPFIGAPGFGGYDHGGDTELDDDNDDAYDGDDGEQSWRGVTDDDHHDESSPESSGPDLEDDTLHGASFSGDESAFGTDSEGGGSGHDTDVEDNDEEDDVFDSLLDVLEH